MARVVRRRKDPKTGKSIVVEVLSDTKKGIRGEDTIASRNKKREVEKRPIIEAKRKTLPEKFPKITKALNIGAGVAAAALTLAATRSPTAARSAGTAVITRTAFRGKASLTTQRAFVGRSGTSNVDKIFHKVRPVAVRFGSNTKSRGLSTSMVSKLGLSIGAAGLFVGAVGSYPFAGFIKEEAIQTLGFAFRTAEGNKDIEGMENALAEVDEIINGADSIMDRIPYLNVVSQLRSFFEAAQIKLENDRKRLETIRAELEAGETGFQRERRETDEAAFERKREFGEEESKRFEDIREENEARNKELQEERNQRNIDELEFESEFFRLIREERFDEAEQLKDAFIKKLKGGN